MANINLKQLEAFVQVADMGSFRRAAERLNTTQPNISARISALEAQLNAKLMERDAGSVRLTLRGEVLLPKARDVLQSLQAFVVAAEDDALFEGVLRLGVTEMIVHSWLGPYLMALKQKFPNVLVDLTVDYSANLSTALFNRSIDLALQSGPFNRATSGSLALGSYPFIWVGAPQLGFGSKVLSLQDLAQHSVLTHARGTLPFEQLKDHIASNRDAQVRLVPSTNMSACLQMTSDGLGVACVPAAMVQKEIADQSLVPLRYLWVPDELSFHARFDAEITPPYIAEAAKQAQIVSQKSKVNDQ